MKLKKNLLEMQRSTKKNITVCYFGFYDPEYSRNRIFLKGLRANNVSIIECRSNKTGLKKYIELAKKHWKIRNDYDVLFVAYPGYMSIILAKLISSKKIGSRLDNNCASLEIC